MHISPQDPLAQAAVPLGSVGQDTQLIPQAIASLSAAQRTLAPVPHRCVPGEQVKSQLVPLHVVSLAPVGLGQAVHEVPQESTLLFVAQIPLQLWVPTGQTPAHAIPLSMQADKHSFNPVGQLGTQAVPSQVTDPPIGIGQVVQDVVPQVPTS